MARKIRQHRIAYTAAVARRAAADVTDFLKTFWGQTVGVHNVEDDGEYQKHDVDLLWSFVDGEGNLRIVPVEVKGDRYHRTGNFFFETVSNEGKGTVGCFLYTKAEWLFYYFVDSGALYCLPMHGVRPWFEENMDRFRERRTSTPVARGRARYVTVGRLVPIQVVLDEVPGVLCYQKGEKGWEETGDLRSP